MQLDLGQLHVLGPVLEAGARRVMLNNHGWNVRRQLIWLAEQGLQGQNSCCVMGK